MSPEALSAMLAPAYDIRVPDGAPGPLPTALLALPVAIAVTALLLLLIDRGVYRFYRGVKAVPVTLSSPRSG